jgi:uncharacterized damage-inducible protein DinB
MTEVEKILDQMRRAFDGKAWCGWALREVLMDVTAEVASRKPVADARSIWEIVLHIAAAKEEIRQHLAGKSFINPVDSSFLPVTDASERAWKRALNLMEEKHAELLKSVAGIAESRLEQPIIEGNQSVFVTLHGCAQHDLYHAAQIALLKKWKVSD